MKNHFIKIEFYKPKYNLDVSYDGDEGLNLIYTDIKDEVYLTVEDYYDEMYCEDVECEISDGKLRAYVNLTDLFDMIVRGEYRNTDGKTYSYWTSKLENDFANRGFWEEFFKITPKDEIDDFMNFIKDYIDIPNLEMDTQTGTWNSNQSFTMSDSKYGMTINDDYTIEMALDFTCKSLDLKNAFFDMQYDNEDDEYYESKGKNKKSLKERQFTGNEIILQFNKNGDCLGFDFESLQDCLENYGFDSLAMLEIAMKKLNDIVKDLNILDYMA